ncbi:Uncharacterized protein DBV15_00242, partial [Temnothorax longispinosus]
SERAALRRAAPRRVGRITRQVLCILRRIVVPRLRSSGICTRANYPSPPLKLQQNLLRRRIGAPRPPVLPVQQPGMPPSTQQNSSSNDVRVSSASLRYERRVPASSFLHPSPTRAHPLSSDIPIPPSASRWNVNSPPPPPPPPLSPLASPLRARPVSRIAIQRREDRLAVLQRKKEREKRAARRSGRSERENERTGARKQIRSAERRRIDTRCSRAPEEGR